MGVGNDWRTVARSGQGISTDHRELELELSRRLIFDFAVDFRVRLHGGLSRLATLDESSQFDQTVVP